MADSSDRFIEVATTRPETMLGDTAVVVHPQDKRYEELISSDTKVKLPLTDRIVPIITNPRIEMEFGTGALKLTPAHAPEDYRIMEEWNRDNSDAQVGYINIIDKSGKLVGPIGEYKGLGVEEGRARVVEDLTQLGLTTKVENINQTVSVCERCKSVIEPIISGQWYVDVEQLKQPAIDAVVNGDVKIHPKYMEKRYLNWMENLREWPISRSLWWGYRFPVWYQGELVEWVDDDGQVREKIGDYIVKDSDDLQSLIKQDVIYVGQDDPNLRKLFIVPGKHGYIHVEVSDVIIDSYGDGVKIVVENIDNPSYEDYKAAFSKVNFDEQSVIVAHSLGCRAIARYVLENGQHISNLIFIAPPTRLREQDKNAPYADFWEDNDKYKDLAEFVDELTVIYSDNDELSEEGWFEEFCLLFNKPNAIVEKNKGHFFSSEYSYVPENLSRILENLKTNQNDLWIQDENVFDTWFSSGQWAYAPLIKHGLLESFYPTSVMETMFDILELWVSRMIMLGIYHEGKIPFHDVYLHGMVLAPDGQKMSKSKGNQIAPDEIINQYGADVLRLFYFTRGKAGGQYAVDYDNMTGNGKLLNKLWNSAKFVMLNVLDLETISDLSETDLKLEVEDKEMLKELEELSEATHRRMEAFHFSVASQEVYDSFWHKFCDQYIETVKTRLYTKDREGNTIDFDPESRKAAQWMLYHSLDTYLKLLHPFIPFITDKLWLMLGEAVEENRSGKSIVWERFNY